MTLKNNEERTDAVISGARHRVLVALKRLAPATILELADALAMNGPAVRHHLTALQELALVEPAPANGDRPISEEKRGRGRPAQRWRLTPAAAAYLPDGHVELTIGLIEATRDAVGNAGLDAILERRGQQQIERYRAAMAPAPTLHERVAVLARLRSAEGYLAEAIPEPDGAIHLVEHHCPICDAARACAGLCANELEVFRAVLAPAIVERTQHLLAGAARCVYRVTTESTTGSS